ncbi:MAG: metallophosphoesterase family protein [Candidatus Villigracilaceae bacterium]
MSIKILAVSDEAVERLYTLASNNHFQDIDLILACGDLPYTYLGYLMDVLKVPLFYVPGNHDPQYSSRLTTRVEGARNLDRGTACSHNLLLAGLGGCIRYRPDGVNQYTQTEMFLRAASLLPHLLYNRLRYGRALDILITHSPPFGIHDEDSRAHQGLKAINWLLRLTQPRYHLHGHTHIYRRNLTVSDSQIGSTRVINVHPYKVIEVTNER